MKRGIVIVECALFVLMPCIVNGGALTEALLFRNGDIPLMESTVHEDELRYLAKIREASEGKWLMGNPFLKEYAREGFSPSGFVEWMPASLMRLLHGDLGMTLFITDILCTLVALLIARLWLGRLLGSRPLVWLCMLAFVTSTLGGELFGILRDVTPKFTWPLLGLYLLLLTLPGRATFRQTLLRGCVIAATFYTYPYHWVLILLTEGCFLGYRFLSPLWPMSSRATRDIPAALRAVLPHALAAFLPLAVLAPPLFLAKRSILSRPEFADFYDRYHIVYTRIPAAPKLQMIVLAALIACGLTLFFLMKKRKKPARETLEEVLPVLLPLVAMMALLNANVVTGKDPELLGHGGRVIMPVVTAAYAVVASKLLPKRTLHTASVAVFAVLLIVTGFTSHAEWRRAHDAYDAWRSSPELQALEWLDQNLPSERVIAAPRILSERIPVFTSHYVFFGAGAHFFFVPTDELADRYLGWVALYPWEQEPTGTATVIIFGNHPGAQWSKERTVYELLHDDSFPKTMADYIPRQDLRRLLDERHASPDLAALPETLRQYGTHVVVLRDGQELPQNVLADFELSKRIAGYEVWIRPSASKIP
jgi:hypothetical protein